MPNSESQQHKPQLSMENALTGLSPKSLFKVLRRVARQSLRHPLHNARHSLHFAKSMGRVLLGEHLHELPSNDRRFKDPTWHYNPIYTRLLQSYLVWQDEVENWLDGLPLPAEERLQAQFLIHQICEAMAPSNTPLNPMAVKESFNTAGQNLFQGLHHLVLDFLNNYGMPSQSVTHAYEVGRNLATTRGQVVFRGELFELIQYRPMSERVHTTPLLIVPSQLNKYYIFDLTPENSFIQNALRNGLQVFTISWRNPDTRDREHGLSSYVRAVDEALSICLKISGAEQANLLGCGTGALTLATLMGCLTSVKRHHQVASTTYMAGVLDTSEGSPRSLFLGEQATESAKRQCYQHGIMDGGHIHRVLSWVQPNDLVWRFWINNYLLGKQPPPDPVLYWANDTIRLTAALHTDLLDFFRLNPLAHPDSLEVCGITQDLSRLTVDSFIVGGHQDMLLPWHNVYRSAQLLGGNTRLVIAGGDHIDTLVPNPRAKGNHYLSSAEPDQTLPEDPDAWLSQAQRHEGTWWQPWLEWCKAHSGTLIGFDEVRLHEDYPPLEAAPGTYVHIR